MRIATLIALAAFPAFGQQVGQPLPRWTPGTLDIHQINTGRGNAGLLIFPDGTTMLLDTGDGGRLPPRGTVPRPNASRSPGEWVVRYIRQALAHDPNPSLDYGYLTHFHDDHMGNIALARNTGRGGYKLTGITEVGDALPFRHMIDRGWPNAYDYPVATGDPTLANYRVFLAWQREHNKMTVDHLRPGRTDQIVLQHDAPKYPAFQVRAVATNGEVWTGQGTETREIFPKLSELQPGDYPTENMCSLAIKISYGRFDYFSGGDLPGNLRPGYPGWQDLETPVARAVGPVDAAILNHHGNRDSQNATYIAALRPQVFVIPVWSSDHPAHDVLDRMYSERLYPGPRDVFATNMLDANKAVIGDMLARLKSDQGHVVIRVTRGGDEFRIIILDDTVEGLKVKSVHGPYLSR